MWKAGVHVARARGMHGSVGRRSAGSPCLRNPYRASRAQPPRNTCTQQGSHDFAGLRCHARDLRDRDASPLVAGQHVVVAGDDRSAVDCARQAAAAGAASVTLLYRQVGTGMCRSGGGAGAAERGAWGGRRRLAGMWHIDGWAGCAAA